MNQSELEERLIDFSVSIIELTDGIPNTRAGNHIAGQLVRSGTSPGLHYGEVRGAESRKDFIHKIQIILKELRESFNALKILDRSRVYEHKETLKPLLQECNELISIFVKTVQTTKRNTMRK